MPGIEKVQRVRLPAGLPTAYRLRTSKRPQGLATFEAIARALGVIESAEVQVRLETLFQTGTPAAKAPFVRSRWTTQVHLASVPRGGAFHRVVGVG